MKKFATMAISIGLIGTMVAGGSLAYLSDTDSDVNVMTLGEVKIAQHEYERATNADGSYKTDTIDAQPSYVLQDFTQGKPLLPIVGDPNEPGNSPAYAGYDSTIVRMTQVDSYGTMQVFAGKNAQDKFVTVENTGKTDAYVRTLVAIEVGSTDGSLIGTSTRAAETHDGSMPWLSKSIGFIAIDGNRYMLDEYLYQGAKLSDGSWRHENGVLPAGDTTYPNLSQVYLKHNATNEDMKAIDGNNNGTLDILVLSQAVQVNGFESVGADAALTAGFGKITEDNIKLWFGEAVNGKSVANAEELEKALANGESVALTTDITLDATTPIAIDEDITINLNGYKLDASANESRPFEVKDGANLTINAGDAEIACGEYGLVTMTEGTLTINGGTFENAVGNNGAFIKVDGDEEMEINLNNVTYKAGTADSGVLRTTGENVTVNITGGEYEAGMGFIISKGSVDGAKITATADKNMMPAIYGGEGVEVKNCEIKSNCHAIAVGGGETITVENCNVVVPDDKLAFQVFSSGGTINVNNCTWTGTYGTTGKMNAGCTAIINIDGEEKYRKTSN